MHSQSPPDLGFRPHSAAVCVFTLFSLDPKNLSKGLHFRGLLDYFWATLGIQGRLEAIFERIQKSDEKGLGDTRDEGKVRAR